MKKLKSLILLIVIAVVVPLLFMNISEKRIAAMIAATLFIGGSILVCKWIGIKSFSGKMSLVFLFLWALPIFFLRVLNWDAEFSTLPRAAFLHRTANIAYLILIVAVAYETWKKRKI